MMNKKAAVFDLDGTILDTLGDIAAAVNRMLSKKGCPQHTVEEIKSFIGNGSFMLIKRALPNGFSDEEIFASREVFRKEYESDLFSNTNEFRGISEIFEELNSKGIKVIVITNKDDVSAQKMIEFYFGKRVDFCRGVRADNDRKPNPELTLSALDFYGIKPEDALFVGDGIADAEVAKKAGIDYIPIGYGYVEKERLFAVCGKEPLMTVSELKTELSKYF